MFDKSLLPTAICTNTSSTTTGGAGLLHGQWWSTGDRTKGLIALSMLVIWTAISMAAGRIWAGVVLAGWTFSALHLSPGFDDSRLVALQLRSFGEHGLVSWISDVFRTLTYMVQAHSFRIDFETRMLIGLGLVVAAALYARQPLTGWNHRSS